MTINYDFFPNGHGHKCFCEKILFDTYFLKGRETKKWIMVSLLFDTKSKFSSSDNRLKIILLVTIMISVKFGLNSPLRFLYFVKSIEISEL